MTQHICITYFSVRLDDAEPCQVAVAVAAEAPLGPAAGEAQCLSLLRKMLTFLYAPFEEPIATALLWMIRPPADIPSFVYDLNSRGDAILRAYLREQHARSRVQLPAQGTPAQ